MADMIADAQAWLAQQQKTHLSRTVTYRRGGAWVDLEAMVGRWEYEQTDFDGGILRAECRDYMFLAADLMLGDERTLPISGDTIEEVVDGRRYIYEVMSPGNEPCCCYANDRSTVRAHVKLIFNTSKSYLQATTRVTRMQYGRGTRRGGWG